MCVTKLLRPTTYTDVMMKLYPNCTLLESFLKSTRPHYSTLEYDTSRVDDVVDFYNRWRDEKQTQNQTEDVR